MLKISLTVLFVIVCVSEGTILRTRPYVSKDEFGSPNGFVLRSTDEIVSQWGPHIMDFLNLIDLENVMSTAVQYIHDPEVMAFIKFLFSPEFKEVIKDFETVEEFKEAFMYLASKGYDVESIINFINTALNLPPFEKPTYVIRNDKGISGFFEAMFDALPVEDMKKLFETKLETNPDIAELFATINSKEFMDIMRRMRQNPKFMEFKTIFEGYGFDFKFLCKLAKEIFGNYYQGVFCE